MRVGKGGRGEEGWKRGRGKGGRGEGGMEGWKGGRRNGRGVEEGKGFCLSEPGFVGWLRK